MSFATVRSMQTPQRRLQETISGTATFFVPTKAAIAAAANATSGSSSSVFGGGGMSTSSTSRLGLQQQQQHNLYNQLLQLHSSSPTSSGITVPLTSIVDSTSGSSSGNSGNSGGGPASGHIPVEFLLLTPTFVAATSTIDVQQQHAAPLFPPSSPFLSMHVIVSIFMADFGYRFIGFDHAPPTSSAGLLAAVLRWQQRQLTSSASSPSPPNVHMRYIRLGPCVFEVNEAKFADFAQGSAALASCPPVTLVATLASGLVKKITELVQKGETYLASQAAAAASATSAVGATGSASGAGPIASSGGGAGAGSASATKPAATQQAGSASAAQQQQQQSQQHAPWETLLLFQLPPAVIHVCGATGICRRPPLDAAIANATAWIAPAAGGKGRPKKAGETPPTAEALLRDAAARLALACASDFTTLMLVLFDMVERAAGLYDAPSRSETSTRPAPNSSNGNDTGTANTATEASSGGAAAPEAASPSLGAASIFPTPAFAQLQITQAQLETHARQRWRLRADVSVFLSTFRAVLVHRLYRLQAPMARRWHADSARSLVTALNGVAALTGHAAERHGAAADFAGLRALIAAVGGAVTSTAVSSTSNGVVVSTGPAAATSAAAVAAATNGGAVPLSIIAAIMHAASVFAAAPSQALSASTPWQQFGPPLLAAYRERAMLIETMTSGAQTGRVSLALQLLAAGTAIDVRRVVAGLAAKRKRRSEVEAESRDAAADEAENRAARDTDHAPAPTDVKVAASAVDDADHLSGDDAEANDVEEIAAVDDGVTIVADSATDLISLRDPLSLRRIVVPVRSAACRHRHHQAFDLATFIAACEQSLRALTSQALAEDPASIEPPEPPSALETKGDVWLARRGIVGSGGATTGSGTAAGLGGGSGSGVGVVAGGTALLAKPLPGVGGGSAVKQNALLAAGGATVSSVVKSGATMFDDDDDDIYGEVSSVVAPAAPQTLVASSAKSVAANAGSASTGDSGAEGGAGAKDEVSASVDATPNRQPQPHATTPSATAEASLLAPPGVTSGSNTTATAAAPMSGSTNAHLHRTPTFACPVCKRRIALASLEVDQLTMALLNIAKMAAETGGKTFDLPAGFTVCLDGMTKSSGAVETFRLVGASSKGVHQRSGLPMTRRLIPFQFETG